MRMSSTALLLGIESSKGEYENTAYDSTKFHLSVDLGQKSNGKTIGMVSRPFKFGDSTEFDKWSHLDSYLRAGKAIPVECDFDVVAAADGVKLTLLGIKPANTAKAEAKA